MVPLRLPGQVKREPRGKSWEVQRSGGPRRWDKGSKPATAPPTCVGRGWESLPGWETIWRPCLSSCTHVSDWTSGRGRVRQLTALHFFINLTVTVQRGPKYMMIYSCLTAAAASPLPPWCCFGWPRHTDSMHSLLQEEVHRAGAGKAAGQAGRGGRGGCQHCRRQAQGD